MRNPKIRGSSNENGQKRRYDERMRDPRACGQQKTADHRVTNATAKHALVYVNERTQQNAREGRPLTDARVQVPHKTPLGTRER